MKKLYYSSLFYVIAGLLSGIFYREFTKFSEYTGETVLVAAHTHILVLGFLFFLIVLVLAKQFGVHQRKGFSSWFIVYHISFLAMISTLVARGIMQVNGTDFAGLPHMAGLSHALLGGSLIWFVVMVGKSIKE
jgi:archaellum biogenesis protein FlaJ (TadC family)